MRITRTIPAFILLVCVATGGAMGANLKGAAPARAVVDSTEGKSALLVPLSGNVSGQQTGMSSLKGTADPMPNAPPVPQPTVATELRGGEADTTSSPAPSPDNIQPSDLTVYQVQWSSVNSGGCLATSPSYELNATAGQAAIGEASSATYTGQAGYWYGAFVVPPDDCTCDCHADPQCDGVTNVLDVVLAVNVAFRGATPVTDPGCDYERTDVDCSGFTNVIDVVKFVNVAFRGGDPAVNFCDPCAG